MQAQQRVTDVVYLKSVHIIRHRSCRYRQVGLGGNVAVD